MYNSPNLYLTDNAFLREVTQVNNYEPWITGENFKNQYGHIIGGTIAFKSVGIGSLGAYDLDYPSYYSSTLYSFSSSVTIENNGDTMLAILAIPVNTAYNANVDAGFVDRWKAIFADCNKHPKYCYVLCGKTLNLKRAYNNGANQSAILQSTTQIPGGLRKDVTATHDGNHKYTSSRNIFPGSDSVLLDKIVTEFMPSWNVQVGNVAPAYLSDSVLNSYTEGYNSNIDILRNIYCKPAMQNNNGSHNSFDGFNSMGLVSTKLWTNLPVFSSMTDLANYFRTGSIDDADNVDDLILSSVVMKTDWTIYVSGDYNPNIDIVAKSDSLEEFINSDENTSKIKLSDIKMHIATSSGNVWDVVYGTTISTNYYDNISSEDINNGPIPTALNFDLYEAVYAKFYNMQLLGGTTAKSSKCNARIGVCGNPLNPNFEYMLNNGECEGLDGSTVTIIYDERAPGVDDNNNYKPPDDSSDITDTDISSSTLNTILTTTYVVDDANLKKLATMLWGDNFSINLKLINQSPLDNIVSVKRCPFPLGDYEAEIKIGNVDMGCVGKVVTTLSGITVGSIHVNSVYNSFLDYDPYTTMHLYLPFLGFLPLETSVYMNHTLSVKYVFEPVAGTCKALIFIDGIYYTCADGNCCEDIPLASTNRASVQASWIKGAVDFASSGNLGSLANSFLTPMHTYTVGNYNPSLAYQESNQCYLIITRPNASTPTTYAENEGYPCNLSQNLGALSGFTVCKNPYSVNYIPCSDEEKSMIKSLLESGIYL